MRKRWIIAIGVICLLIGLASGFVTGVRVGVYEHMLLNGAVKASLLAGELRALRAGNVDGIIRLKELELDGEIASYALFRDGGHPWIFWPISEHFEHDRYMKNVAGYRRIHPPVTQDSELRTNVEKALKAHEQ